MGVANHRIDRHSYPYRPRHYELHGHVGNSPVLIKFRTGFYYFRKSHKL